MVFCINCSLILLKNKGMVPIIFLPSFLCNLKMSSNYTLYRESSLGKALTDTLDELIQDGQLDPQTAMKVLAQFDVSIAEALHSRVRSRATLKGHLHVYRFCDDVWTFVVDSANFRFENETIMAKKVKVVACSAKA